MTGELPVWVSGQQLWVRGVDRKTTCNDVITALLGHPDENYVIIERWRKVERPLGNDTRLLKLWTAWGDAQKEVRLSLRRIADDDSGRGSPASVSRRRKHHRHKQQTQTLHPKRLAQLSKTQNIERLLKLILVQGETIHSQLKRLHDREDQIEHIEEAKHRARVNILGSNYLLETYLGENCREDDEKEENDSGVVTEGAPSSENTSTPTGDDTKEDEDPTIEEDIEIEIHELQKQIELWEKIVKVNKKLEKEEETLVKLYVSVKRCDELGDLKGELDKAKDDSERAAKELEVATNSLSETETALETRMMYLKKLQYELEISDKETERLMRSKTREDRLDEMERLRVIETYRSKTVEVSLDDRVRVGEPHRGRTELDAGTVRVGDPHTGRVEVDTVPIRVGEPLRNRTEIDSGLMSVGETHRGRVELDTGPIRVGEPFKGRVELDAVPIRVGEPFRGRVELDTGPVRGRTDLGGSGLMRVGEPCKPRDNDSNSDTGLSSLHSSSEEGTYVLDTLV